MTIAYGGTFFLTTLPAPIAEPLPTVTPASNVTLLAIHTSSSTMTSLSASSGFMSSVISLTHIPGIEM